MLGIALDRDGETWEALTKGLPQADCYVNVLRDARDVDSLIRAGFLYFGTTGGQVYASNDAGESWNAMTAGFLRAFGRGPDAGMIRVLLPAHLRTLARAGEGGGSTVR